MKSLHIVNGKSAAGTLKHVLKKTKKEATNEIYCFEDFLSVGPLFQIETKEGQQKRNDYLLEITNKVNPGFPINEISNVVLEFMNFNFSEYKSVTVWYGNNAAELLLKFLSCKAIENKNLHQVAISKLNDGDKFPNAVGACTVKNIASLLNASTKISQENYYECIKKWNEITQSKGTVRIYKQGIIVQVPENYYDQLIIDHCTHEFKPALRIAGEVLGKSEQLIGDTYITYRLLKLIEANKLDYSGDSNDIHSLLVKKN